MVALSGKHVLPSESVADVVEPGNICRYETLLETHHMQLEITMNPSEVHLKHNKVAS